MPSLQGFHIRPPTPAELPAIHAWFQHSSIGPAQSFTLAAFGQPGDIPLAAAIIRPSRQGKIAHFQLFVLPHARRRRIGSTLLQHLFHLAKNNHTHKLILADLIPADSPENLFWQKQNFSPEASLLTHTIDIQKVLDYMTPLARRFASHPHLRDTQVLSLASVDPRLPAEFSARHYSGFIDQQIARINARYFDPDLSVIALRDNDPVGLLLFRSHPDRPSVLLDLILTHPDFRNSPLPLLLLTHAAPLALAAQKPLCVFEADPLRDPFPTTLAQKTHARSSTIRHRYSITAENFPGV